MMHRILPLIITLLLSTTSFADKPNVVFILADDLGYGGLHCYGTDWLETPNIDRLCQKGMDFSLNTPPTEISKLRIRFLKNDGRHKPNFLTFDVYNLN